MGEPVAAKIAHLRDHAREYRRLAAEHRAADNLLIADKLLEAAADCDAKAAELERLAAQKSN
ncbi:MAG TPA: hypothetical protein VMF86_16040 [Stellaceae bacterium]|nr:hypothetical protein [Stellaceae bacterium]